MWKRGVCIIHYLPLKGLLNDILSFSIVVLYDHVMGNLRQAVAQLEENELFEQTLRRGSQAALQIQPSTNDIDTLMRSMMSGDNMPIRKQQKK